MGNGLDDPAVSRRKDKYERVAAQEPVYYGESLTGSESGGSQQTQRRRTKTGKRITTRLLPVVLIPQDM